MDWRRSSRLAIVAVTLFGAVCGERSLALQLTVDTSCTVTVPTNGSLLYEVLVTSPDGVVSSVCGGCLAPPSGLPNASALVDFLRTSAPACHAIAPGSSLKVRVNAWNVPMCPAASTSAMVLCAESPAQTAPDGHDDAVKPTVLNCSATCAQAPCVPLTCSSQSRSCGSIQDGCGHTLSCGSCRSGESCQQSGNSFSCQ
jgi:hypothetical protein